ncbi:MAG: hypothetical protein WD605_00620 [Candidatus Paceibacterota bacterium]
MQKFKTSAFINTAFVFFVLATLFLFAQNSIYAQVDVNVEGEASNETRADTGSSSGGEATMCTADAYQCPNGEWVGRTGPNCEFVCSDGSTNRRDIEVIEYRDGDSNRNASPGSQIAPSQTRVLTPVGADTKAAVSASRLGGIEIDVRDEDSDGDGLNDGTESTVSGRGGVSVRVDGVVVRGWDAETKAAVRARLQEADDRNNANDFGLFVAIQAIDHEEIKNIEVKEGAATVSFETTLNILGIIPVKATANTTVQVNGEIETSYPWWSFLASKPQNDEVSVFSNIAATLAARTSVE